MNSQPTEHAATPSPFPAAEPRVAPAGWERLGVAVFGLMLIGLGLAFGCAGWRAVRDRAITMERRFSGGVFVPGLGAGMRGDREVIRYTAADARRVGTGVIALGTMLGLVGIGVASGAARGSGRDEAEMGRLGRVMVALSAAALGTAVVCAFPPWQAGHAPGPTAFWLLVVVASALVAGARSGRAG